MSDGDGHFFMDDNLLWLGGAAGETEANDATEKVDGETSGAAGGGGAPSKPEVTPEETPQQPLPEAQQERQQQHQPLVGGDHDLVGAINQDMTNGTMTSRPDNDDMATDRATLSQLVALFLYLLDAES